MDSNRGELMKEILIGIGLLGLIVITGAMAPNIFSALGRTGFTKRKYNKKTNDTVHYLKRKKLITIKETTDGKMEIQLSKNGENKVLRYKLESLEIQKMKKWDGKWRFVIFDIPNKFKERSNVLREKLKELGLYQFQKSVWVYPYPLENEIELIAQVFEVRPFIKLGEMNQLEGDWKLKKHFELI